MTQEKPKQPGRFTAGVSGNSKGRPRGKSDLSKLRSAIVSHMPEVIAVLLRQALAGDVSAAKALLQVSIPALRPVDVMTPIKLPGTGLANDGRAVLAAVAAGELSPAQGAALIGAVASLARVVELDEMAGIVAALEARIEAMEAR